MRSLVGGYRFFEEDAKDRNGGGDYGGGGFDGGPDGEFFAVVGKILLTELDHVDAFCDCAYA